MLIIVLYADLNIGVEMLQNLTLVELEKLFEANRSSLKFFPIMSYPNGFLTKNCGNRLIYAKLNYDIAEQRNLFQSNLKSMTGLDLLLFAIVAF